MEKCEADSLIDLIAHFEVIGGFGDVSFVGDSKGLQR